MIEKLPEDKLQSALEKLENWHLCADGKAIQKSYKFSDFKNAWAFMNAVAILAEEMNHHPEWSNVYNSVDILLTTHSCAALSQKDIDMAMAVDKQESNFKKT